MTTRGPTEEEAKAAHVAHLAHILELVDNDEGDIEIHAAAGKKLRVQSSLLRGENYLKTAAKFDDSNGVGVVQLLGFSKEALRMVAAYLYFPIGEGLFTGQTASVVLETFSIANYFDEPLLANLAARVLETHSMTVELAWGILSSSWADAVLVREHAKRARKEEEAWPKIILEAERCLKKIKSAKQANELVHLMKKAWDPVRVPAFFRFVLKFENIAQNIDLSSIKFPGDDAGATDLEAPLAEGSMFHDEEFQAFLAHAVPHQEPANCARLAKALTSRLAQDNREMGDRVEALTKNNASVTAQATELQAKADLFAIQNADFARERKELQAEVEALTTEGQAMREKLDSVRRLVLGEGEEANAVAAPALVE